MVRVKVKKQKGDDAFTKRKQKVGRKKLAPATATRAEIHARTLRLNSSPVLTRASEALHKEKANRFTGASATEHSNKSVYKDEKLIMTLTFTELMANVHHYKSSQRASAFASLQRLLREQAIRDTANNNNKKTYV